MDVLVGRLQTNLQALDFSGLSTRQTTAILTTKVAAILRDLHTGEVRLEHPCPNPIVSPTTGKLRQGYLDLALIENGRIAVAIEIDRSNKRFSLAKLEAMKSIGALCIWVRWKTLPVLSTNDGIHVISLAGDRASARNRKTGPGFISSRSIADDEVTVWLTKPLWARDPSSEEMFQSNRHVAYAAQVIQDAGTTRVVNSDGEIVLEFPTESLDRCTWARAKSRPASTAQEIEQSPASSGIPVGTKEWRRAISRENPRAYEAWTDEEDEELRAEIQRGASREDIAKSHQRRRGAITSRINKLGLD